MKRDLVIVGSGSLARSLCCSLATVAAPGTRVAVLARSAQRAGEVAYLSHTRASASGTDVSFTARAVDIKTTATVARVLDELRPSVLVNCASVQSPWERTQSPSEWTSLLSRGGFGLSLPLHAVVARQLAMAVAQSGAPPLFVNASYPDAVNPLLHAMGLPIFFGIGNVDTLEASLRAGLRARPDERIQVLGHHLHLHAPELPEEELKVWRDGVPVTSVGSLLTLQRSCNRELLNLVTGHAAAELLTGLLDERPIHTSVPGPLGLPGGYPVEINGGHLTLDLPEDTTSQTAHGWQVRWAEQDGVNRRLRWQGHLQHRWTRGNGVTHRTSS
jgi:hypothetical protein